ncbi:MAG: bifunctional adenosylcobinamide kinase/adenosylcobinamide-phosphate guanylyltransferase [Bacteroidales bacterium]|nr:bifunctional adenosylcobinamide kinase/adenosylcobinamide-phosphate guanylyltransferase [Bacteroidales bacterium]
MKKIILITGGERSGKSSYAEGLALSISTNPVYIATAHIWDEEFRQRVLLHQQRRGQQWTNIEEEINLAGCKIEGKCAVIDCITLWLTNLIQPFLSSSGNFDVKAVLENAKHQFDTFTSQDATFIFVTNEIGSGGVSPNPMQRRFTDLQGWMNQYIAGKADEVYLMVSGIPVKIK